MKRPRKYGIRVKHSSGLVQWNKKRGGINAGTPLPSGWYLWLRICGKWQALTTLRFIRKEDARRARAALTAAGLDHVNAMRKAGGQRVKEIACDALGW